MLESTKERNAREIATRLKVDPNLLGELSKLTDGSTEAIEVKANMLPKVGEPAPALRADPGGGTGSASGKKPSLEELQGSNPEDTIKKFESGEWAR